MRPEEWLGIVHWLSEHDVKLTADVAVKYGAALQRFEADRVRQAIGRVLDHGQFTLRAVQDDLGHPSSKWAGIIGERHRTLFPNGCRTEDCDLCR